MVAVAELVSAYPTAGGMYFVTKHVVPKEHVAIWAWVIGWCNFLGQATGVVGLQGWQPRWPWTKLTP